MHGAQLAPLDRGEANSQVHSRHSALLRVQLQEGVRRSITHRLQRQRPRGRVNDRKSMSGVVFFLGGSTVTWTSQKQKVMATSSCEVEYVAAAAATCQGCGSAAS